MALNQSVNTDNLGSAIIAGEGTAGSPVGGVVSIQGVTGGSAVPSSQSGVWNINNISGTISLPTGAATSANQLTEITSLQLIDNPVGSSTGGTAGTSSFLAGGIFSTTLPTLSNGEQSAIQLDSSGRMIVVGNVASGTADSGNGVKVSGVYNTTVPALTNGQRGDTQLDSRGAQQITPLDGCRQTYSVGGIVTLATAPQDVATLSGSATKTIRVTNIRVHGLATTAITIPIYLLRRITANTGGTSSAGLYVGHDTNNAPATAVTAFYTANPTTLGTVQGYFRQERINFGVTATDTATAIDWSFNRPSQAIVLRGANQFLAVNLGGNTVTGGSIAVSFEWTEE